MTKVEKIEQDVRKLDRDELLAFRRWFREYDSDEWDRQIEEDVRAGKLDKLAGNWKLEQRVGGQILGFAIDNRPMELMKKRSGYRDQRAIEMMYRYSGINQKEIGRYVGEIMYTTVSRER